MCSANRAEHGLLKPIVEELNKRKDVEALFHDMSGFPQYPLGQNVIEHIKSFIAIFNPDIVLLPCDRNEMVYVAAHTFHEGKIVAHFHCGDVGEGTSDESNRFAISFLSHIFFCNSVQSAENLYKMGFEFWRVHVVGSTALDGVEIDESLCPREPYDLVLLHPDPVSKEATLHDLTDTLLALPYTENKIVWFYPNADRNNELIRDYLKSIEKECSLSGISSKFQLYENVPRSQFLGLLKNCSRAIGNSSSFTYELPLLNSKAKYVQIGHRNKTRTPPNTQLGASKQIAEILATIPIDDKLRRKKLIL